jgi:nucleoside phosphorylase
MSQAHSQPPRGSAHAANTERIAVILTAIPVEYLAVRSHLQDPKEVVHPSGTVYEVGRFGSGPGAWTVAIVETGAGNDAAAVELERAVQLFRATHALFVGVAGGVKDVSLGDVVASSKIYGYESGKDGERFNTRPDVGEPSYQLLSRARAVSRLGSWTPPPLPPGVAPRSPETPPARAWIGAIAAGAKVVASRKSATADLIQSSYGDTLAMEMEGRGFLRAGHASPGLGTLVVRGISDLLDDKAKADGDGWQEIAAGNAASFAFTVLAELSRAEEKGRSEANGPGRSSGSSSVPQSLLVLASVCLATAAIASMSPSSRIPSTVPTADQRVADAASGSQPQSPQGKPSPNVVAGPLHSLAVAAVREPAAAPAPATALSRTPAPTSGQPDPADSMAQPAPRDPEPADYQFASPAISEARADYARGEYLVARRRLTTAFQRMDSLHRQFPRSPTIRHLRAEISTLSDEVMAACESAATVRRIPAQCT